MFPKGKNKSLSCPQKENMKIFTILFHHSQKWGGKKKESKNFQNFIFGFQCVTINIEGWLKIYISYLVYSQIWLNHLPRDDDHQLFLHLHADDHHFRLHNKFLKKALVGS
jgi:hypothetical protein